MKSTTKQYNDLEGIDPNCIKFTNCDGNPIPIFFLEKDDTLTLTICGTEKTPIPKKVIYKLENNVLKLG